MATIGSVTGAPHAAILGIGAYRPSRVIPNSEVVEAIDEGNPEHLAEELGDLLWQVVVHAQIAQAAGEFTLDDVVATLEAKIVRRHPHVFDPEVPPVATAAEVYPLYRAAKAREKAEKAAAAASRRAPGHQ